MSIIWPGNRRNTQAHTQIGKQACIIIIIIIQPSPILLNNNVYILRAGDIIQVNRMAEWQIERERETERDHRPE